TRKIEIAGSRRLAGGRGRGGRQHTRRRRWRNQSPRTSRGAGGIGASEVGENPRVELAGKNKEKKTFPSFPPSCESLQSQSGHHLVSASEPKYPWKPRRNLCSRSLSGPFVRSPARYFSPFLGGTLTPPYEVNSAR